MPVQKKRSSQKKKAKTTRQWSAKVTTDSTHPPEGLFNKSAAVIARSLASKTVSPKGPASGMRMLTFYINRAGHNLSAARKVELQKAKKLLSKRIKQDKVKKVAAG
jgi:RNA polymerase-interacting CarD/CdnL/TRCF family regulator